MVSTSSRVGQEPVALGRDALSPIHRNDECRGVLKGQEGAPALLGQWFSRQQTNQKRRVLKLVGLFRRPDATPAAQSFRVAGVAVSYMVLAVDAFSLRTCVIRNLRN